METKLQALLICSLRSNLDEYDKEMILAYLHELAPNAPTPKTEPFYPLHEVISCLKQQPEIKNTG